MKQELYVIATRGRNNKEIYLACDENSPMDKIFMKWTENIDEAFAMFTYTETEEVAKKHFKNYNKWYIKSYSATFK